MDFAIPPISAYLVDLLGRGGVFINPGLSLFVCLWCMAHIHRGTKVSSYSDRKPGLSLAEPSVVRPSLVAPSFVGQICDGATFWFWETSDMKKRKADLQKPWKRPNMIDKKAWKTGFDLFEHHLFCLIKTDQFLRFPNSARPIHLDQTAIKPRILQPQQVYDFVMLYLAGSKQS